MMKSLKMLDEQEKPWYSQGLHFKCTGCGQCCTGAPGYVWITPKEMITIAKLLNLSLEEFEKQYVRKVGNRFSLIEDSVTYDCVFLKENKCQIYSERPKQCRTYPWWPQHLKTPQDWAEAAKYCEGIIEQAELIPCEEISKQLSLQCDTSQ